MHFKFHVITDGEVAVYKRDRLLPKGCVQVTWPLYIWEITDNISETVQYRNIVAMEDMGIGNGGRWLGSPSLSSKLGPGVLLH